MALNATRVWTLLPAAFLACLCLPVSAAPPPRQELEAAALAGNADAAYRLGLDYDLGSTGQADPAGALRWYLQAAQAGLPSAEFNVAVMLDSARGVSHDAATAAVWYARAAAHGHERAAYNLGQLYASGDGTPRNAAAAAAWLRVASSLPAATARLASLRASSETPADGALLPPAPTSPVDQAVISPDGPVELVWTPPSQGRSIRFYVEIVTADDAQPRRVFARLLDPTATLAPLDGAGSYAWRVYAVDAAAGRYAASPWARFALRRTGRGT